MNIGEYGTEGIKNSGKISVNDKYFKEGIMMKRKRILALIMTGALLLGSTGCSGKSGGEQQGDKTVIYYAASGVTSEVRDAYLKLVETYNETQGVEDNIYVQMNDSSGEIGGLDSALRSNYMYDVVQLNDDQFKPLAMQGQNYFVAMDDYLTDEAKEAMNWDQIPANLVNRFRMNQTQESDGMFLSGEGTDLLGIPNGSTPHVLYYNKGIMENSDINVISVSEDELEDYNSENGASLKPHGYAEYKEAPFADAVSGTNEAGDTVYKVFNDRIAMNWEELRCLSRYFQTSAGCEYGYMSEWWFNYGWSVGGDCVGWDESKGQYVLTLNDKQPNYLALSDITVNDRAYSAGDVLLYEDKAFLNQNASEKQALDGKIYELPSSYDAILEFNRLGVPSEQDAEAGIKGYGVAPATTENRATRFTSGTDCPLLVESLQYVSSYKSLLGDNLDMTMPAQYREYVGGSTYQKGGADGFENEYLKVIGETYDGQVYTGDLHYEGDTPIVGRCTVASTATGFFIPANTKNKNYDAAFKFISWAAGEEGQAILASGNITVPNQTSLGLGECADSENRAVPNMWAASYLAQQADIGDYTYFTSETWITEWSVTFNNDVRRGNMTLTEFGEDKQSAADTSLKGMRIKILGR